MQRKTVMALETDTDYGYQRENKADTRAGEGGQVLPTVASVI